MNPNITRTLVTTTIEVEIALESGVIKNLTFDVAGEVGEITAIKFVKKQPDYLSLVGDEEIKEINIKTTTNMGTYVMPVVEFTKIAQKIK
jgi:hypothetical protein